MSQSASATPIVAETPRPPVEPSPTAGAQTVQAAPGAVKRSMPMALSILLGILLAALAAWLFQTLAWFLLLLYLSFVAATVLEAPVSWIIKHGLRRGFAAVVVMLAGLAFLVGLFTVLANGLYAQGVALSSQLQYAPERINELVKRLGSRFPGLADHLKDFNLSDNISQAFPSFATLWTHTVAGFVFFSSLVVAFFIVMYMLVDGPDHLKAARCLLPKSSRLEATRLFNDVARAHRGWALASLINVTSATLLMSTGLYFLGVPGALIFGFIAGLGELIPNVGPFFGALPALLFTLLLNFQIFPYVAGMFIVMQAMQSYTITPRVLRFSIKLPVLVTIISVLAMGALFGLLGVIAAIPLVTDMVVLGNYLAALREKDPTDYDCANPPAGSLREPPSSEQRRPSFMRLLPRRRQSATSPTQH